MDSYLFNELHKNHVQKPNVSVLQGVVDKQCANVLKKAKDRIRNTAKYWPDWLKFIDLVPCTPEQSVRHQLGRNKGPVGYELKGHTVFMVELHLSVQGEESVRAFWLPYTKNGLFTIRGTEYMLGMVLTDLGLSVDKDKDNGKIFLSADFDKLCFSRMSYHYNLNGTLCNDSIPHYRFYKNKAVENERKAKELPQYVEMLPILQHYLCARYGLRGVCERYFGIEIEVGDSSTITTLDYPADEYFIFSSTKIKPKAFKRHHARNYEENDLRIAVKAKDMSRGLQRLIAGVYYVSDHHPKRLNATTINSDAAWRTVLGYVYFNYSISEMERKNNIDEHMNIIYMYLDEHKRIDINEAGYFDREINDFYDLLMGLVESHSEIIRQADPGSMFNKRIRSIDYLLDDFYNELGRFSFNFRDPNRRADDMSRTSVNQMIGRTFYPDTWISNLNRNLGISHGEIRSLDSTCPCKAVKVSTVMVMQENVKKSANEDLTSKRSAYAHPSIMSIGSTMQQPKWRPDSRAIMNSHVIISPTGIVETNPVLNPLHIYAAKFLV